MAQLASEIVRFDSLLRRRDSAEVAMGIEVLRAMARSSDTVLASGAVRNLVRFANVDSALTDSTVWKNRTALRAIGAGAYTRALPTLDSLLKTRVNDKVHAKNRASGLLSDMIRDQILRTATGERHGWTRNAGAAREAVGDAERARVTAPEPALKRSSRSDAGVWL